MQTIGERLEEARKRLGISLREASEATKIRIDYLQQMENGSFAFSLPDVYKRGFLKIYGRHLKLDAEKLAADFNAQSLASSRLARRDHLGRVELPGREGAAASEDAAHASPMATGAETGGSDILDQKMIIRLGSIFVGIVFILVLAFYGVERLLNSQRSADSTTQAAQGGSNAADQPGEPKTTAAGLHLVLTAKDDISLLTVRQVSDRKVLFEGPVPRGQSEDITADTRVEITVTSAENLHIEQNGQLYALKVTGMQDFYWPTKTMASTP
jgi:cytoskeletal protein RodZ